MITRLVMMNDTYSHRSHDWGKEVFMRLPYVQKKAMCHNILYQLCSKHDINFNRFDVEVHFEPSKVVADRKSVV